MRTVQPQWAVELGSFIGYSALLTAMNLPPGGKLVCVEANPECVAAIDGVLRHAGLRDRVEIEQGLSNEVIPYLAKRLAHPVQLLFQVCCCWMS